VVERDYLSATVACVPLARWRKIVRKAVEQAEDGDGKARTWLATLLVGSDPIPLQQLAEELKTELERIKFGNTHHRNGTPTVVRGGHCSNSDAGRAAN
jgi:hypothetical protein